MFAKRAARVATSTGPSSRWVALAALFGAAGAGCFKPDDGREPPLDRIYFPVGLALSPDGDRLYVANSDWDLQFNAGSVQAYDAARLRELLPRYCERDADCADVGKVCDLEGGASGGSLALAPTHFCVDSETRNPCPAGSIQPASERLIEPGLCGPVDNRTPDLLLEGVRVGAFATDLLYRVNPAGGGRLFVPVRSDATLHWIDVRGGVAGGPELELDCGQNNEGECDANHRRGDDASERSPLGDGLPIEPYAVDASADGETLVVSHQTEGKVSLFVNDWDDPAVGPSLQFVLEDLTARPVHVSAVPVPAIARDEAMARELGYAPGYWLAFRGAPFIQLVRYVRAEDSPDGTAFLARAFADRLSTTASSDVRGMAADASARSECELGCADDEDCLIECAGVAVDVYLASRSPASLPGSLLIGNTTSIRRSPISNDRLQVSDVVPIDAGPARTVMGSIIDQNGERQRRVFVASFDSRSVTIYDPDARTIEARVVTGRGPTALAIDAERALAYVAHFTDSYIGVIDLDRRHHTFGSVIMSLGEPTAPRGDR